MPAAKKVALVADIKQDLERAEVAIGSDHSGLDVQAFQALRRALSPADVRVRVVKNSLTKLAAEEAGRPEMAELLQGPTTLTLGYGDPVAPARLLMEYLRAERVDLPIYGAWLEGRVLSAGGGRGAREDASARRAHRPDRGQAALARPEPCRPPAGHAARLQRSD